MEKQARDAFELQQVEKMLRNLPRDVFVFRPPHPPIFRVFIRTSPAVIVLGRHEMTGLVRHALVNRVAWGTNSTKGSPSKQPNRTQLK